MSEIYRSETNALTMTTSVGNYSPENSISTLRFLKKKKELLYTVCQALNKSFLETKTKDITLSGQPCRQKHLTTKVGFYKKIWAILYLQYM